MMPCPARSWQPSSSLAVKPFHPFKNLAFALFGPCTGQIDLPYFHHPRPVRTGLVLGTHQPPSPPRLRPIRTKVLACAGGAPEGPALSPALFIFAVRSRPMSAPEASPCRSRRACAPRKNTRLMCPDARFLLRVPAASVSSPHENPARRNPSGPAYGCSSPC